MYSYEELMKGYQEDLRQVLIEKGISFTEDELKLVKPHWLSEDAIEYLNEYVKLPPEKQAEIKKALLKQVEEQRKKR